MSKKLGIKKEIPLAFTLEIDTAHIDREQINIMEKALKEASKKAFPGRIIKGLWVSATPPHRRLKQTIGTE